MTALRRRGMRIAVPVALAGATVVLGAAPAFAAATLAVSGSHLANGRVEQPDILTVSGSGTATDPTGLSGSRTVTLRVVRPDDSAAYTLVSKSVASNKDSQISATVDTSCAPWNGCAPAVNGHYTFRYDDGNRSDQKDVVLAVPPAAPQSFGVDTSGAVATFSWNANSEPDLVGYDIVNGSGDDVTPGGLDADSVCASGRCEISVDFGSAARGTSRTFTVFAWRHTAPGSASHIVGPASAPATATFATAPGPSGSPASGGSGGSGSGGATGHKGSGGTSGGGGATGGARPGSHSVSGKHPAADLDHSLPSFSAGAAPDLPSVVTEVEPLPQGTYKPTLAYQDQTTRERVDRPADTGVRAAVTHNVQRILDTAGLWRGLAAAAVLFLVVAHLRSWIDQVEPY